MRRSGGGLHKILTDAGIRLSVVVSDIQGKSARQMIEGLLAGETPHEVLILMTFCTSPFEYSTRRGYEG